MSPEPLRVRKIVYPGRSLGTIDGKACFTDEGLPGEMVDIERLKEKSDLIEAHTVRIIEPSPHRVEPRCLHHRACSPYQIADYPHQLTIKAGQLHELMAGFMPEGGEIAVEPSPLIWGYRNKVRLRVLWTAAGALPAYNQPGSRDRFVPASDCRLLPDSIRGIVAAALGAAGPLRSCLEEIEVKVSGATGEALVLLHGRTAPKAEQANPLLAALIPVPGMAGIIHMAARSGAVEERLLWGGRTIVDALGGIPLRLGPDSFFQVNASIMPAVLAEMRSALDARRARSLADIYCGVGAFGLALGRGLDVVYAVESDPEAVACLKANASRAESARFTVCDGSAAEWMSWVLDRGVDAAIVDPPRKGLEDPVLEGLTARPVPLLLYLSCNPATLARDLRRLQAAYRVVSLRGYDFFPHTPHIETLAILEGIRS